MVLNLENVKYVPDYISNTINTQETTDTEYLMKNNQLFIKKANTNWLKIRSRSSENGLWLLDVIDKNRNDKFDDNLKDLCIKYKIKLNPSIELNDNSNNNSIQQSDLIDNLNETTLNTETEFNDTENVSISNENIEFSVSEDLRVKCIK